MFAPSARGSTTAADLRVLHVMASGARGGGADHLRGLLPALRDLGLRCRAAVGSDGPLASQLEALGIAVEPVELMARRLDPSAPRRLAMAIAGCELVHFHGTRAAFFGALARPLLGRRGRPAAVYTVHGLAYRQPRGVVRRTPFYAAELIACRGADRVVSVSRRDLLDLQWRRFVAARRGIHLPNAIRSEHFAPHDGAAVRRQLGLADDAFVVGTVSRLVPQKDVACLVDAVARLPEAHLVVVGDGPLRQPLCRRAAAFAERVHWLGSRDDVAQLLAAVDVFVLASRWEGEPIALLEAMAAGKPCIATATEGAREIVTAERTGVLVAVGDPQALAGAINALQAAPERAARLGAAARRAVEGRRYDQLAVRVASVYAEIMAQRRR